MNQRSDFFNYFILGCPIVNGFELFRQEVQRERQKQRHLCLKIQNLFLLTSNTEIGNVSAPDTKFEGTGTYTCDTGYIISDKNTKTFNVTCIANGTWSEAPPSCTLRGLFVLSAH